MVKLPLPARVLYGYGLENDAVDRIDHRSFESTQALINFITSFQLIKDDLRRDQALALLRESDDSVQAVALRVGFREATVFIKAFRQWTGMTPGDYRARLKRRRGG